MIIAQTVEILQQPPPSSVLSSAMVALSAHIFNIVFMPLLTI